ncbi:bifunctional diguanylate cyclase/phosphodiesterase [Kangiella marina]|uniref:EAL domain-containing protein n=1 Tax=Kangiella marina TaxID=1079178 RepID=A0ABP8IDT8_9GAMM
MIKSYRGKLILLIVLALSLIQVGSSIATLQVTRSLSQEQAIQSVEVGAKILQEVLQQKESQYRSAMQVIVSDFGFKSAVATQDRATLATALDNHTRRIQADLVFLTDNQLQQQLSAPTISDSEMDSVLSGSKPMLNDGEVFSRNMVINQHPYMVVFAPVKAPTIIGWVGMGFLLDETVAEEIKQITNLDVGFVAMNGDIINAYNTTEVGNIQQHFMSLSQAPSDKPQDNITGLSSLESDDLMFVSALSSPAEQAQLYSYMYISSDSWLKRYLELRNYQLVVFLGVLAVAIGISIWLAKEVSRPVEKLVRFARGIGKGESVEPPTVKTKELSLLATTLQQMDVDIKDRQKEIVFNNTHDILTGLSNRNAAEHYLKTLLDKGHGTLIILNIKKFRLINDSIGYANGDLILKEIAARLEKSLPDDVFKARLASDEFLVAADYDITKLVSGQILPKLQQGIAIDDSSVNVQIKAGIYYLNSRSQTINDMMRCADIALSKAKRSAESYVLYQQGQDENYQRQLHIIGIFEESMADGSMYLQYQPKVNLATGKCTEAEALLRWQDKELGFISPEEFIQLAELSGNIRAVTDWVVEEVIKQIIVWQDKGLALRVSVNISVDDLLDVYFRNTVRTLLEQYRVNPRYLTFEITESVIMSDPELAVESMDFFKDLGINIAIDDFGTGYSSLSYLKKVPANELKIDKSFVIDFDSNEEDRLIVETSIGLAHSFGMKVVAEGVETEACQEQLVKLGCDIGQGYFYTPALLADDFEAWSQKFNSKETVSMS